MIINYVTGSEYKVFMMRLFMKKFNIEVNQIKMYVPEIQETEVEKVAAFSSAYAFDKVQLPVMKNDSGLYIPALNNFPAAYTRFAEESLGEDGILKLMENKQDRSAYWLEALAFTDEDGTKIFTCKSPGRISYEKSGDGGWGYDKIFIPDGQEKTLANFDDEARGMLWNQSGYDELANYVLSKQK